MTTTTSRLCAPIPGKRLAVAYLLWFGLGYAGLHRVYLGRKDSGVAQLALFVIGCISSTIPVGMFLLSLLALWWLYDAVVMRTLVADYNCKHGLADPGLRRAPPPAHAFDELDTLGRLHWLRQQSILSEDEYQQQKARLKSS